MLLQCLPKEPMTVEYKISKAKRKKTDGSRNPDVSVSELMWMIKLTNEKLDIISQTITESTCKEIFMVVQSLLKSTASLNPCNKVK